MNEIINTIEPDGNTECVICYQPPGDDKVTCDTCRHLVCRECYNQLQQMKCPMCRTRYPGSHPLLSMVDNSHFHLIVMELVLLYEQRRILNQCRTIWDLHLRYLRRTVGMGDMAIMIMIGETDLILGRVSTAITQVDQSIEELYSTLLGRESSSESRSDESDSN